jgi:hypothetical protein
MGILTPFEEKGGIMDLIKGAINALKLWKNRKIAEMWSLWLQEVESFSSLPQFFELLYKDREKKRLLFDLISGVPDIESNIVH